MDIQFIFLDESFNNETRYSSLTGILIPLDKFEKIRDEFYENILNQFIIHEDGGIDLKPIYLHGNELLKGTPFENNDEKKIELFHIITKIINENSIKIYRLSWLKDKSINIFKELDHYLMSIIFPKFIELIDKDIEYVKVIPIMDGLNTKSSKIFSRYIKTLEILRRTIKKTELQIKNSENIYGEVYYADSKYSIFTQLVDMISYMLHCRDIKKFRNSYSDFKGKIIEETEKIKPNLINYKYYHT